MAQNVTLRLNKDNQLLVEQLKQYAVDNPDLINRFAKQTSGPMTTNRLVNSVLAEFGQLFLKSDLNFIDREKQLLTTDG